MGTVRYNAPGLFFAALFLVLMAVTWLRSVRRERCRTALAADYVEPTASGEISKHIWQPATPPSPAMFGLPDEQAVAQLSPVLRWFAQNQLRNFHVSGVAQATVVYGTTLTVFENLRTTEKGAVLRTLIGSFDLAIDAPGFGVMRDEGLGTVGAGLVHFESDDFNRVFSVACNDTRFAYSLIDGEMMIWLLSHQSVGGIGIHGPHVLVHFSPDSNGSESSPDDMADFVAGFIAHVRPVVYSGWGHGAQQPATP